ncbi:MAG: mechanosensitive ion channel domain-containing protein [Burkholderiales bacterium]
MNEVRSLGDTLGHAASAVIDRVLAYLPSIFGAVLLLIVGWAVARLLRALTMRAVLLLDQLLTQFGSPVGMERFRVGRASAVLGAVVFWVTLLLFVTAASQVLGLQAFTDWLATLIDYLPTLTAGGLIVALGYILSRFVSELVRATATRFPVPQRNMLARIAQVLILAGAILVGADQIGIKITFLAIFAAAVASAVVGGVAFAVGFGARDYVANLIGAHYLRQAFLVGQTIRVGEIEGRILEVTATVVVLETPDGRVTLPGRIYNEQAIAILAQRTDG